MSAGLKASKSTHNVKPKPQKPKLASDRFQQQQLSFVKRDAAAPVRSPVSKALKADATRKRSSLDSMSSRTSAALPLSRRSEHSPERALKHKTARHHASPSRERAPQAPTAKPKAASKYFGEQRSRTPKKTALLSFVAQLEEKKSARSTTLDEYLALDQKQKDAVERLAHTRSRSPAKTKWDQAKARFRAKQAPQPMKTGARALDKWLTKPKAPPPPVPQTLDESSTPPRLKLKPKASPRRSSLSFLLPEHERTATSPAVARAKDAVRDEQQQRKRKRSGDFSSPAKRLKQVRLTQKNGPLSVAHSLSRAIVATRTERGACETTTSWTSGCTRSAERRVP